MPKRRDSGLPNESLTCSRSCACSAGGSSGSLCSTEPSPKPRQNWLSPLRRSISSTNSSATPRRQQLWETASPYISPNSLGSGATWHAQKTRLRETPSCGEVSHASQIFSSASSSEPNLRVIERKTTRLQRSQCVGVLTMLLTSAVCFAYPMAFILV